MALLAGAVGFWLWQFSQPLSPLISSLGGDQQIEVRLSLPSHVELLVQSTSPTEPSTQLVNTNTHPIQRLIEVGVTDNLIPLLKAPDNRGERELIRSILIAISRLLPQSSPHVLTAEAISALLDEIAPVGLKKMLLLFDTARTPEVDDRGLRPAINTSTKLISFPRD